MIRAISQSHKMESSMAFFIRPFFRFVKVAWEKDQTNISDV